MLDQRYHLLSDLNINPADSTILEYQKYKVRGRRKGYSVRGSKKRSQIAANRLMMPPFTLWSYISQTSHNALQCHSRYSHRHLRTLFTFFRSSFRLIGDQPITISSTFSYGSRVITHEKVHTASSETEYVTFAGVVLSLQ